MSAAATSGVTTTTAESAGVAAAAEASTTAEVATTAAIAATACAAAVTSAAGSGEAATASAAEASAICSAETGAGSHVWCSQARCPRRGTGSGRARGRIVRTVVAASYFSSGKVFAIVSPFPILVLKSGQYPMRISIVLFDTKYRS